MSNDPHLFAAQLRRDIPTLDLHDLAPVFVLEKLDIFLYHLVEIGESEARIIYGIGEGKLSNRVIHHLQDHKLIAKIVEESGSAIVLLKDY